MPTYFKVVRRSRGKLRSYFYDLPQSYQTTYIPGKWTVPKDKSSKLFICRSLRDARSLLTDSYSCEIWECAAKDVSKIPVTFPTFMPEVSEIKFFWKNLSKIGRKTQLVAAEIKLLKKVY